MYKVLSYGKKEQLIVWFKNIDTEERAKELIRQYPHSITRASMWAEKQGEDGLTETERKEAA